MTVHRKARRLKARLLGALSLLGLALSIATPAWAQKPFDADIQGFHPAMDARSFITVDRSRVLGTFEPSIGLFLDYAFTPFEQEIDGKNRAIIDSYGAANLVVALGFYNIVQIGAQLPIVLVRGDFDGPGDGDTVSGDGLGDLRLAMKIRILDRDQYPLGIALMPIVQLATGQEDAFVSHGQSVIFRPKLILDFNAGSRVGLAVNLGATLRDTRRIDGPVTVTDELNPNQVSTFARTNPLVFGNQFDYGLGVGVQLLPQKLEFVGEIYGAVGFADDAQRANPLEVLGALRLYLLGNSFLTVGVSSGILGNVGDPTVRPFAGIVFEPTTRDRDGDGIPDDIDQCPDEPEDFNGFEDEDGCPDGDRDTDGDGIPDMYDQCPNDPEDYNGFEDDDGCPDGHKDSDGDGIPDYLDKCPLEKETYNGFQDEDGCPDEVPQMAPPPKPEPPQRRVVIDGGRIQILDKVYFETNKDIIKQESYEILIQVADTLKENPQLRKVEVQGHTDSRGRASYNLDLSKRRAASVRRFLIERGVEGDRLTSMGYGSTMPIAEGENASAWATNRRVEFVILEEN